MNCTPRTAIEPPEYLAPLAGAMSLRDIELVMNVELATD